jgi:hypothetical protein
VNAQVNGKNSQEFWTAFNALPEAIRTIKLSGAASNAVRKAVTAHHIWDEYRKQEGIDASQLTRPRILHAAFFMGLDVPAIAAEAEAAPKAPKEEANTEMTIEEAAREFERRDAENARKAEAARNAEAAHQAATEAARAETERRKAADEYIKAEADKALKARTEREEAARKAEAEAPKASPDPQAIDWNKAGSDPISSALAGLLGPAILNAVRVDVERMLQAAIGEMPATVIKVQGTDGEVRQIKGQKHPKLDTLIRVLSGSSRINVWLAGPTGSGKTHAAKQAAEALGIPYHFTGASSQAFELLGFIDANGTYHETEFVKAYRDGGLWLGDEIDAWDNSALLALNAALANGECSTPIGLIKRHDNFRCVAAANTFGGGATSDFVGRAKIDAAFLSRFAVKLSWDYDEAFERAISGNADFAMRVQMARRKASVAGLKVIIDPRHSQAGAALIASGFSSDEAAKLTYLAGLKPEQVRQIEG